MNTDRAKKTGKELEKITLDIPYGMYYNNNYKERVT